jgi:ectoine hydroxylase
MRWNQQHCEQFEDHGYLFVPGLFSTDEISGLNQAVPDLLRGDEHLDSMHRERERSGAIRQVYLAHRYSPPFNVVSEDPAIVEPVKQILQSDVYVWHSKINVKDAFEGTVWLWHQDYGYWMWDGVDPRLVSVMVFLDKATINNGCLMVAAGSHKWGRLEHSADEVTTSYKQWCVDTAILRERLTEDMIQHVTGEAGDALFFHCNLLHASGHNLSPLPRKTYIIAYNAVTNRPRAVENPRPDWVVSRRFEPVTSRSM